MQTTREDIARWFSEGVSLNAEFMLVAVDTFDWEGYPVYLISTDDFEAKLLQYQDPNKMSKVMEVYDLKRSRHEQLNSGRVWNTPANRPAPQAAVITKCEVTFEVSDDDEPLSTLPAFGRLTVSTPPNDPQLPLRRDIL